MNEWDQTFDLIVAGTGVAALAAAVAGADAGLKVLMLESTDRWGGSSAMSGGGRTPRRPARRRRAAPGRSRTMKMKMPWAKTRDRLDVAGKVFVVTGGGSGIGREVVLTLLHRGARVAAVDLNGERLAQTAALAGRDADRLTQHQVNVTDADAVARLPQEVLDAHGAVDGLLNVAGIIQKFVHFNELQRADIERVLSVNFWGVVNMVQAFLPHLLQRPQAALVNVSSMGAFIPVPGQTVYGASKAAVKLLTEGLHAELRGTPVRVTVVFPGAVATSITENSGVQAPAVAGANQNAENRKVLPPKEAAEIIVDGMERGDYRVLVGRDAQVMDGLTRLVPERAMTMIADQMAGLLQR